MEEIERNDIKSFFDIITYCYQCRINIDASTAIKVLEVLIEEYGIIPHSHIHMEEKRNHTTTITNKPSRT